MARLPDGFRLATDSNGDPVPGAYLYVYRRGTTTPVTTYSDSALSTANTHPVEADASGAFGPIYLASGSYKVKMTTALGVDLPGTPIDNVECADEIISVADLTAAAAAAIYPAVEVRVRSLGQFLTYAASEPDVTTKVQDASGYWFGAVTSDVPTPEEFGAAWDGSTDDTAAINAWAAYLRTSGKAGRLPAGTAYCAGTLYLGSVRIVGAGGPTLGDAYTSKTVILSDGNPMLSMAPSAASHTTYYGTHWEGFTVEAAGGTVAAVELWDYLSYPYQIGLWLGRSHQSMQTVAGGETATAGGSGGITIRGVAVQDASGWGLYAYKLWGKSLIDDVFFRRCGGLAAYTLGDDRLGGAMNFAGVSVDFTVSNVHCYPRGHDTAAHDNRGSGLRIGGRYDDVYTTCGRYWETGGNQKFQGIFVEGHALAVCIEGTQSAFLDECSIEGATVQIGHAANPSSDCKVMFGRWRSYGALDINVTQSSNIDLGQYLNQDSGTTTTITYMTGFEIDLLGAGVDGAGVYSAPVTFVPDPVTTGVIGSRLKRQFNPQAFCSAHAGDMSENLLAPFSTSGAPFTVAWTGDAAGFSYPTARWKLQTRSGETTYYELTGLTEGDVYSAALWTYIAASVALGGVTYGFLDSAGAEIISRSLGSTTYDGAAAPKTFISSLQVAVPADGVLRFFVKNTSSNDVYFRHPVVTLGHLRTPRNRHIRHWHTPAEVLATTYP
jgi:hypothetical protein